MGTDNIAKPEEITVYRPNQRHEIGILKTWAVMASNVWKSRELVWQLFKRDFLATYKKSFIGFTWIFITPILGIVSWVFLRASGMLNPGDVDIPYPAYVLIGTTMWGLFLGMFTSCSNTLMAGQMLVMQVSYPHEVLLFKQAAEEIAKFLIAFLLNVIVLLVFRIVPSWQAVLFPLVVLPLLLTAAALGLFVSMLAVVAVDLSKACLAVMALLLYAMPIIYAGDWPHPMVQAVSKWNPLTYLVCSARDIVIYGRLYEPTGYFICAALSIVLFMMSWRLFYVSEHKIVERMI